MWLQMYTDFLKKSSVANPNLFGGDVYIFWDYGLSI